LRAQNYSAGTMEGTRDPEDSQAVAQEPPPQDNNPCPSCGDGILDRIHPENLVRVSPAYP